MITIFKIKNLQFAFLKNIEKGFYKDNYLNKKLGRVGQAYGKDANYEYKSTESFRRLQTESNRLSKEEIQLYQRGYKRLSSREKRNLGTIYEGLFSRNNGTGYSFRINLESKQKGTLFMIGEVKPKLFHDIFEINQKYLNNGELVDLHEDYSDCKCFITNDGLGGFAIEKGGNLVSVFSLNTKPGFLYAIKDFVRKQGATHLDCFLSQKQNLAEIYEKTLGFYIAAKMDFNEKYDEKEIGKEHSNPKVAFMVNHKIKEKIFDKDSYNEAKNYQLKNINKK